MALLLLGVPLAVAVEGAALAVDQLGADLLVPQRAPGEVLHRLGGQWRERDEPGHQREPERDTKKSTFPNHITTE